MHTHPHRFGALADAPLPRRLRPRSSTPLLPGEQFSSEGENQTREPQGPTYLPGWVRREGAAATAPRPTWSRGRRPGEDLQRSVSTVGLLLSRRRLHLQGRAGGRGFEGESSLFQSHFILYFWLPSRRPVITTPHPGPHCVSSTLCAPSGVAGAPVARNMLQGEVLGVPGASPTLGHCLAPAPAPRTPFRKAPWYSTSPHSVQVAPPAWQTLCPIPAN